MLNTQFRLVLFGFLFLASGRLLAHTDADRVHSLAQKLKCDCGCGEVLGECSHRECTRRPKLKQEITDAVLYGRSDDQILQQMATAHGTAVLVTPGFEGFDMLLWGVPVLAGIFVVAIFLVKFRKRQTEPDR
jgi:cytochrome c-type biogenesis protein CcmH